MSDDGGGECQDHIRDRNAHIADPTVHPILNNTQACLQHSSCQGSTLMLLPKSDVQIITTTLNNYRRSQLGNDTTHTPSPSYSIFLNHLRIPNTHITIFLFT